MKNKKLIRNAFLIILLLISVDIVVGQKTETDADLKLLQGIHSISSHRLFEYVQEQTLEKYEGRLTGTPGYYKAAQWVASLFQDWGIDPLGDGNTYLQEFDIPYTLVFPGCEVYLNVPTHDGIIRKYYRYIDEFMPGSTSGSGVVTAEVVYVGYGVTAPELRYDDYQGMDVKGKIVLIEREVPVSPDDGPDLFKKWRPYSFHQYKLHNAVRHGARGMLYNYGPIANPNNAYDENFIYVHVGDSVVTDLFAGTGRNHPDIVDKIKKGLQPQSFGVNKRVTIKMVTEHHESGRGFNVIGIIKGNDPVLSEEVVIVGGHLDHLGMCYEMIPGANDNASAVAVMLGVAEALKKSEIICKRSIMFIAFGAEEQAVFGSRFYLDNPRIPIDKTVCLLNMDGVGCGDKLRVIAAENYPELYTFIDQANKKYIHRIIKPTYFHNLARPRLDAARFMWAGVPTLSFSAFGAQSYYHTPRDAVDTITPEILEDLAQILFVAILDMANDEVLDFYKIEK